MRRSETLPAVRCDPELKRMIEELAKQEEVSIGAIQRRALRFFFSQINTKCGEEPASTEFPSKLEHP
jgi:hypothetical protein